MTKMLRRSKKETSGFREKQNLYKRQIDLPKNCKEASASGENSEVQWGRQMNRKKRTALTRGTHAVPVPARAVASVVVIAAAVAASAAVASIVVSSIIASVVTAVVTVVATAVAIWGVGVAGYTCKTNY